MAISDDFFIGYVGTVECDATGIYTGLFMQPWWKRLWFKIKHHKLVHKIKIKRRSIMAETLTVGQLRAKLEGVDDGLPVFLYYGCGKLDIVEDAGVRETEVTEDGDTYLLDEDEFEDGSKKETAFILSEE